MKLTNGKFQVDNIPGYQRIRVLHPEDEDALVNFYTLDDAKEFATRLASAIKHAEKEGVAS